MDKKSQSPGVSPFNPDVSRYVLFSALSQSLRKYPNILRTYDFDILAESFRNKVISKLKSTAVIGILTFFTTDYLISNKLPTSLKKLNRFKMASLAIAILTATTVEHAQRMQMIKEMSSDIDRYLLDPRYIEYMREQNIEKELLKYLK